MEINKFLDFSVDTIPTYLKDTKEKLINMGISLDRYEISKSLTISLNRILMGNKIELIDIYDSMINNFDEIEKKNKLIEEKIKNFNLEQKFEYFIDPEKILYIIFFKQIIYIKKLIEEIYNYINSNINLVFIYSFLISKLYNEPNKVSFNYIFILNKIISNTSFISNYDERLKKFISPEIIDKIFLMIKIIYSADIDFVKLMNEYENKKMEEYKKNNYIDYYDSYKEIEKKAKNINDEMNIKGGKIDIYEIEDNFQKTRDFMFIQKRKITIKELCNSNNLNLIFQNSISIELWFGYNLFVYKRFEFNFNEYQTSVNELIESKGLEQTYLLSLNYLNDINAPDAGILPIVGGNVSYTNYYSKYIKYKNKYLKLKALDI